MCVSLLDVELELLFVDAVERAAVFKETGIEDSFVIKYSDISNDVKATIIRNVGGNTTIVPRATVTDNGIRELRVMDGENNHWRRKVSELPTENVDMKGGGIYVETEKYDIIKSKFTGVGEINTLIAAINKYNGTTFKVHCIGQNLMDGKLFKTGNWIKLDKYVADFSDAAAKKSKNLRLYMAYFNANLVSKLSLSAPFSKFIKDKVTNEDCRTLASLFAEKYDGIKAVVELFYKSEQPDIDEATALFTNIIKNHPLIRSLNARMDDYGVSDEEKVAIAEYLNKV